MASVGGRIMYPIFADHLWNLQELSSTGSTRTTDSFEASLLTSTAEEPHSQQALSQGTINDIHKGSKFTVNSKERRRNERIEKLASEYTRAGVNRLIHGIAPNYMTSINFIYCMFEQIILYNVCLNRLFYILSFDR